MFPGIWQEKIVRPSSPQQGRGKHLSQTTLTSVQQPAVQHMYCTVYSKHGIT